MGNLERYQISVLGYQEAVGRGRRGRKKEREKEKANAETQRTLR
jgi:hypothetical protein